MGWKQGVGRWIYQFQANKDGYTLIVTDGKVVLVEDKTNASSRVLNDTLGNVFDLSTPQQATAFYAVLERALSLNSGKFSGDRCVEIEHNVGGAVLKWHFDLVEADATRTDAVLRSVHDGFLNVISAMNKVLTKEKAQVQQGKHQVKRLQELLGPDFDEHKHQIASQAPREDSSHSKTGLEIAEEYWPHQDLMQLPQEVSTPSTPQKRSRVRDDSGDDDGVDEPNRAVTPDTASEDEEPSPQKPSAITQQESPAAKKDGAGNLVRRHRSRRLKF